MGQSKQLYMDAHEAAMERYMEANPDADEQDAYEATADQAWHDLVDMMADMIDAARDAGKELK